MITSLIEKKDNFQIVRDQIAAILKLNVTNQMALAAASGKDETLWDLRVFSERNNPWEEFQDAEGPEAPIVNVWYDSSDFDDAGSSSVNNQKTNAMYNVDIYACGVSAETADGHSSGDESAALTLHNATCLVRNILMAGAYTYLGLRGTVWGRKVTAVNIFQPSADNATVQNIIGARISFRVTFTEESPQVDGVLLEAIVIQVDRAENGEILVQMEYPINGS
jgi:hypothetical protein